MLAFPSNHYKDKIRGRKSTPKLSAYNLLIVSNKKVDYIKQMEKFSVQILQLICY